MGAIPIIPAKKREEIYKMKAIKIIDNLYLGDQ
jgi:hypothetical protein